MSHVNNILGLQWIKRITLRFYQFLVVLFLGGHMKLKLIPTERLFNYFFQNITCFHTPHEYSLEKVQFKIIGLTNTSYRIVNYLTVIVNHDIYLLNTKFTVTCGSLFHGGKQETYTLNAEPKLFYEPNLPVYLLKYRNFTIKFHFELLNFKYSAKCHHFTSQINNTDEVQMYRSNYTKNNNNYSIFCILLNTTYIRSVDLKIHDSKIHLALMPEDFNGSYFLTNTVWCIISTPNIPISDIDISTNDTLQYTKYKNTLIFDNIITIHNRCICIECHTIYNISWEKCLNFHVQFDLQRVPDHLIYFSYEKKRIDTFFLGGNMKYLARCYPPAFSNITARNGYISLDTNTPTRTYTFLCSAPLFRLKSNMTIDVLYDNVEILITPISLYYVGIGQSLVICTALPDIINRYLDIGFHNITSNKYIKVNFSSVLIGGSNSTENDTICFTCGHFLLRNKTRCYNYFNSTIQIEIMPEAIFIVYTQPTEITCTITPPYLRKSEIQMGINGLNKSEYSVLDAVIKINTNEYYDNKPICVFCGNLTNLNVTKCYVLVYGHTSVWEVLGLLTLAFMIYLITMYIKLNEVM